MIDKINTSQLTELLRGSADSKQQAARQSENASVDASLQADYDELIKRAATTTENNSVDLQKIKELLSSGQLDNPENIKLTAQNIIELGF